MPETLDDRTAAYILETRRPFEDLRQVASQLAGLLVLAASGAKHTPDHPMLAAAREMFGRAADQIRAARPTARSRPHHGHLLKAVAAIDQALRAVPRHLGSDRFADVGAVLDPLKSGYGQLQEASEQLPGFEVVAFDQGCCGNAHLGHAGQVGQVGQTGQVGQVGQVGVMGR